MFNFLLRLFHTCPLDLLTSLIFDDTTFYEAFIRDLKHCKREVIIESPFITTKRMNMLLPVLHTLISRKVKVVIVTRSPQKHENKLAIQAERAIQSCEFIGIQVLLCSGSHHRKIAILDREILYEGSLNILSQGYSREIMRRIKSVVLAKEMCDFLKIEKFL